MIPAASQIWRPRTSASGDGGHPAVRLLVALLAVITVMIVPPLRLVVPAVLLLGALHGAGLRWRRLPAVLVPWWPVVVLVLAVHTLTATDAAPLWRPSLVGLGRGLAVLARLALMMMIMGLAGRSLSVRDLTVAARWLLRPLRVVGLDTRHLGLTLAVALGTAPRIQAEAARLQMCRRLRQPAGGRRTPWRRFRESIQVVPPLMDGLARRAETLPLMLAHRIPAQAEPVPRPPWWQLAPLVVWSAVLIWLIWLT